MPALARQLEQLEQALLERVRPQLDRAQHDVRARCQCGRRVLCSASNSAASYGTKSPPDQ